MVAKTSNGSQASSPGDAHGNGTPSNGTTTVNSGSIMICRNKHYPYIASYHGPWLSLPIELLQSLFTLNKDTTNAPPPVPIDPIIFRHLIAIRRLVDDASELVIKAAGGGSSNNPLGISVTPGGVGGHHGGGGDRNRVSYLRQHRLRELAVAKLARAYRIDEVATSVLTMQSASALDDVAAKILKRSPTHMDATYVHFFHEKIPSRMLASSTTTEALDKIIAVFPAVPEYYRTRAMIRCFREEYALSLRDFKIAIALAKKRRRNVNGIDCEALIHGGTASIKQASALLNTLEDDDSGSESQLYFLRGACFHLNAVSIIERIVDKINEDSIVVDKVKKKKKKKKKSGTSASPPVNGEGGAQLNDEAPASDLKPESPCTPSIPSAPASFQDKFAAALVPVIAQINMLARRSIRDYTHFLTYYPNSLPAFHHSATGASMSSTPTSSPPESPVLAPKDMETTAVASLPDFLMSIPSKSLVVSPTSPDPANSVALNKFTGPETNDCENGLPPLPPTLGTYHPLLVEAWYAIGLNYLLLGDWRSSAMWHERITAYQDTVEGYPVFLPARSMSQADYVEILRLLKKAVSDKLRKEKEREFDEAKESHKPEDDKKDGGQATQNGIPGTGNTGSSDQTVDSSIKDVVKATRKTTRKPNLSVSTTVSSTPSTPSSAGTNSGSQSASNLRQYPLHTKRADTIMMYLQFIASRNLTDIPPTPTVVKPVPKSDMRNKPTNSPLSNMTMFDLDDEDDVSTGGSRGGSDSSTEKNEKGRFRKAKKRAHFMSAGGEVAKAAESSKDPANGLETTV